MAVTGRPPPWPGDNDWWCWYESPSQSQYTAPKVGSDLKCITPWTSGGRAGMLEGLWNQLGEEESREAVVDPCHMLFIKGAASAELFFDCPERQACEVSGSHVNGGLLGSTGTRKCPQRHGKCLSPHWSLSQFPQPEMSSPISEPLYLLVPLAHLSQLTYSNHMSEFLLDLPTPRLLDYNLCKSRSSQLTHVLLIIFPS